MVEIPVRGSTLPTTQHEVHFQNITHATPVSLCIITIKKTLPLIYVPHYSFTFLVILEQIKTIKMTRFTCVTIVAHPV